MNNDNICIKENKTIIIIVMIIYHRSLLYNYIIPSNDIISSKQNKT